MRRTAALLLLTSFTLAACSRDPDPVAEADRNAQAALDAGAIPQRLDIRIDGKPLAVDPDRPLEGQVAMAYVARGLLGISVHDNKTNHTVMIEAPFPGQPRAGNLLSYVCKGEFGCDEPAAENPLRGSTLGPSVENMMAGAQRWSAYKAPKLNLQPLVVKLASIESVIWPGVGAAYRIKGTFQGTLADAVPDWSNPRINGPTRQLEGSFDMYAMAR
jgi:hypothetical protein